MTAGTSDARADGAIEAGPAEARAPAAAATLSEEVGAEAK